MVTHTDTHTMCYFPRLREADFNPLPKMKRRDNSADETNTFLYRKM